MKWYGTSCCDDVYKRMRGVWARTAVVVSSKEERAARGSSVCVLLAAGVSALRCLLSVSASVCVKAKSGAC